MKRHGDLWSQISSYENIQLAHHNASNSKGDYEEVKEVNSNVDLYLTRIQNSLLDQSFTTSEYTIFEKDDGRKKRILYKLPYYPDRIIQHALVQVCGPIWVSSFIRDTYQSIKGRGTSDARKRVQKKVWGNPNLYTLKFDIRKFYPSVVNHILKEIVRRKIKCPQTLWLIDNIIDSCLGLPIGNYTSQFLGNLFLSPFDWWVVQTLKPYSYHRYCDDIVIIDPSKQRLHEIRKMAFQRLNTQFELQIKSNWQVFPIDDRGLDFCGYVFRSNSTRIRKSIANNLKFKARQIRRSHHSMTPHQVASSINSYWGWCKHTNAKALFFTEVNKNIQEIVKENQERISAM